MLRVSAETVMLWVSGWGWGESKGGSWNVFFSFRGGWGDLRFKGVVERCEWLSCVKGLCGLDHLIVCVCGDSEHFLSILCRQNLHVDSQVTLHFG